MIRHRLYMTCTFSVPKTWKAPLTRGLFAYPGVVNMACPDTHLTGAAAARRFGFHRTWCNTQRTLGHLQQQPCGHYLYRDVQRLEAQARASGMVLRGARALIAA